MIQGYIHSIETAGLVDGPGIRFVTFMQGCPLRCAYCHNPDSWCGKGSLVMTPEELYKKAKRYSPYFRNSKGGVTLSGGEALMQIDFAIEYFKLCKENNIHTALDTSGFGNGNEEKYLELLKYTDLVILDIKHIDNESHRSLTGKTREDFFKFLKVVTDNNNKLWIRHVVVPGLTDSKDHITKLSEYINTIPNVEKVELLPYHNFGVSKYEKLGLNYPLGDTPPLSTSKLKELNELLNSKLLKSRRHKHKEITNESTINS